MEEFRRATPEEEEMLRKKYGLTPGQIIKDEEQPHLPSVMTHVIEPAAKLALRGLHGMEQTGERYIGAPLRAAARSYQMNEGLGQNINAARQQIGAPVHYAPTYGELYEHAGVPHKPAYIAGEVTGAILSPLNALGMPVKGAVSRAARLKQYLKDRAEDLAQKAVIGRSVAGVRKAMNVSTQNPGNFTSSVENIRREGRDLLNTPGAIEKYDTMLSLGPKMEEYRKFYGNKIGDIATEIDKFNPNSISAVEIADDIRKYAATLPKNSDGLKQIAALEKEADTILANHFKVYPPNASQPIYPGLKSVDESYVPMTKTVRQRPASLDRYNGKMGFNEAQNYKNSYKYNAASPDAHVSNQDISNKLKDIFKTHQEKAAENYGKLAEEKLFEHLKNPHPALVNSPKLEEMYDGLRRGAELAKAYKENKRLYKTFKHAEASATNREALDRSLRFAFSPSDVHAGVSFGAAGFAGGQGLVKSAIISGLAVATSKFINHKGAATAARIYDNIHKVMIKHPEFQEAFGNALIKAADQGAKQFVIAHHLLMKNPQYKAFFEEQNQ